MKKKIRYKKNSKYRNNIIKYSDSNTNFFQILNMMFGYFEYTILLKEIINYPLNKVDDEITEDLYKNIILMSKEPNNIIQLYINFFFIF